MDVALGLAFGVAMQPMANALQQVAEAPTVIRVPAVHMRRRHRDLTHLPVQPQPDFAERHISS